MRFLKGEGCHYLVGSLGSADVLSLEFEGILKNCLLHHRIDVCSPQTPASLRRREMGLELLVRFQAHTLVEKVLEAQTVYSILDLEA